MDLTEEIRMKGNVKSLIIVLCALMVIASLTAPAFARAKHVKEVAVTGTINEKGALVGENGKTYSVAQNDKGKNMILLVGKRVEAKGTVETKNGVETITVSSFKGI